MLHRVLENGVCLLLGDRVVVIVSRLAAVCASELHRHVAVHECMNKRIRCGTNANANACTNMYILTHVCTQLAPTRAVHVCM